MLFEEVEIGPHSGELRPPLHVHHILVHIVDLCAPHGQQEGGVGGYDELAPEEPGRVLQELRQLLLARRGEAVLRLVQKVQAVLSRIFSEK